MDYLLKQNKVYSNSNFGWSIDINKFSSGILIGAPKTNISQSYEKKNLGAAWYYTKYKDVWRKFAYISPNSVKNGEFGKSVAVNDHNLLAIGEPYYSNNNFSETPFDYGFGAVHLYSLFNTPFPITERLATLTGNGQKLSQFGYSIDLNNNGDILVVGAPTDVNANNNITGGKVYLYQNIDNNWQLNHILTGTGNFDYFGKCVKINSGNLIVIAENESFHVYDYNNNILTKTNSFPLEYNNFQTAYNYNFNKFIDTDINGEIILIGNPYQSTGVARLYKKISNVWQHTHSFTGNQDFQFFGASVGLSNTIPVQSLVAPNQIFATEQSSVSFIANWNSVPGATYYIIDVSTNENFSSFFEGRGNLLVARTNLLINNLTPGTTYYVRVRAANFTDISTYSPILSQVIGTATPSQLITLNIQTTSFVLNWGVAGDATSYRLDVSTDDNFTSFVNGYQDKTINSTSDIIMGLVAGTIYYSRVRAVNSVGISPDSSTIAQITAPIAPNQPTFSNVTDVTFAVTWNSVMGASEYIIDIATTSDFTSGFVDNYQNRVVGGTSINAIGLNPGTAYYVRVRAINTLTASIAQSIYSLVAMQLTVPSFPKNLTTLNTTTSGFTINWLPAVGATSYRLDVSTVSNFATRVPGYDNWPVNSTSHQINGLAAGTTYYSRVRAVNSTGTSSNSLAIKRMTLPAAPNVTVETTSEWRFIEFAYQIPNCNFDNGGLAFGNGFFVGTPRSYNGVSKSNSVFRSTDGVLYSEIELPLPLRGEIWKTMVYFNNRFMAAGGSIIASNFYIYSDDNGITWNQGTFPSPNFWTFYVDNNIGRVYACGNSTIAYSSNGLNWTSVSVPGVNWGDAAAGSIAVGNGIAVLGSRNSQGVLGYSTNGGETWGLTTIPNNTSTTALAFGNNIFVLWDSDLDIYTSNDGINWVYRSKVGNNIPSLSNNIRRIIFHQGYFHLFKEQGNIFKSADGINWTPVNGYLNPALAPTSSVASDGTRMAILLDNRSAVTTEFKTNWGPVFGASSYRLDIATTNNFTSGFLPGFQNKTIINATSDNFVGMLPGIDYYIRVRAVNAFAGVSSSIKQIKFPPDAPNTPTVTNVTTTSFIVNWNNVQGATSYRLDVSDASNFASRLVNYNDLVVSGTTQQITGLVNNTTYYARVRTVNELGTSSNSPSVMQTTLT